MSGYYFKQNIGDMMKWSWGDNCIYMVVLEHDRDIGRYTVFNISDNELFWVDVASTIEKRWKKVA